jgi:phosphotransferase system HPr-like phosphotransfer protein
VPAIEREIRNRSGLHARPAALFVEAARRFSAEVTVANETRDPTRVASQLPHYDVPAAGSAASEPAAAR